MRKTLFLALAALCCVTAAYAQSLSVNCTPQTQGLGKGVKLSEECKARNDGSFNTLDAYYEVVVEVVPGEGFDGNARFGKNSTKGKVLAGLLETVFSVNRGTALDIGITFEQGDIKYPPRSLLYFQMENDDNWRSYVRGDTRTYLHRLGGGDFRVVLNYLYSDRRSINLQTATDLLESAGVKIITPAVKPIVAAANTVANAIINANGINVAIGYDFTLAPANDRFVSKTFLVQDPRTQSTIATVRVRLQGKRSLLADAVQYAGLPTSTPKGEVSLPDMNSLSKQIATGQARDWDLLNGALGATRSLTDVPLGKAPDGPAVKRFCTAVQRGLTADYGLTSFDSLLVGAKLVEAVTIPIRNSLNPYPLCFSAASLKLIEDHTDIDLNPPIETPPLILKDYEGLQTLGCYLAGKSGDDCGTSAEVKDRTNALLADSIIVGPLEGVIGAPMFEGLPQNRTISRDAFLTRFGNRFIRFFRISTESGWVHLQEVAGGATLRLVADLDTAGKVRRISITRP